MDKPLIAKNPGPLRVGLLIDSFSQPRWIRRVIDEIQSSKFARVVLVVKNDCGEPPRGGLFERISRNRHQLLFSVYTNLDNRFSKVANSAFELVDTEDLCRDVPVINVTPLMKKFSDQLNESDVEKIREYDLDVGIRFGFRILRGGALNIARFGVWSYHHDDSLVYRGGPPGFWEVMQDDPVTGSMLQVLTEDLDNGQVMYRSWAPTINRFSVKKNNNNYYWKTAAFVGRKLSEVHRTGAISFADQNPSGHPAPYSGRLYKVPQNREMFGLLWNLGKRALSRVGEKLRYKERWSLAYCFHKNSNELSETMYRFTYLEAPAGHFWADPFPVNVADKFYLFFENFSYASGKAVIAMVEVGKDGSVSAAKTVLERDYHLSYPFLFEWQDTLYMIPESGSNNSVELYRCKSFPLEWEKEAVLLEANNASDATLIEFDGKWWMFVNIQEEEVTVNWEETHLYFANTPLGPWHSHPQNPVKSDVRNSRPAGHLFLRNGQLMRPAQDCSRRYGYATAINRITTLTEHEFCEEEIAKIRPEWDKRVIGTHTINTAGELTVIDCILRTSRFF